MMNNVNLVISLNNVDKKFNDINYACGKVNEFVEELRELLEYEYSNYSFISNFSDNQSEMKILISYNELDNEVEVEEVTNSLEDILFSEQLIEICYNVFDTKEVDIEFNNDEIEEYDYIEPTEYEDPYNDEELIASK